MNDTPVKAFLGFDSRVGSRFSDLLEAESSGSFATWDEQGFSEISKELRLGATRRRWQNKLLALAFKDDLTGLYNRRGFQILAEQLWKIARAKERRLLFFFGDLDGLKQINDRYGHREGDRALLRVAASFRKTFRGSAVAARIGGDEFIALLIEGPRRNVDSIRRRLQSNLARRVADNARYAVTLSIGASLLDPQSACNLDELIVRADRALYAQKQLRFTGVAANSVATVTEHLARPICESAANSSPYEKGPAASSWSGDSRQSGDRLCGEARR